MRFEQLLPAAKKSGVIESSTLLALGAERKALNVALSRWVKDGKLIQLRRGIYMLPERFRRQALNLDWLANLLVRPSYVSKERALALHGIIPERVPLVQSITTKRPMTISTEIGEFAYQHVSKKMFFGFTELSLEQESALIATPEKALLDLLYLSNGDYSVHRIRELRLQNLDRLNPELLIEYAGRTGSKRLARLVEAVNNYISEEGADLVTL